MAAMGKRSSFKRRPQDAYDTPPEAVAPLLPHLPPGTFYAEPCAGKLQLVEALGDAGHKCTYAHDIAQGRDALKTSGFYCDYIITNPPWTRQILHPMIDHFRKLCPTWLLFDADWMHTKQAIPFLPYCRKIVSVGRVSWMQNGTGGMENCAWYLFDRDAAPTEFFGPAA